ncbi:hypothetical protein L208DRAFT_1383170 [Tricholoma matsutake]|nr:hypothetical protein L208DRAFT_1383170 [Tricholoma matsutake 945]
MAKNPHPCPYSVQSAIGTAGQPQHTTTYNGHPGQVILEAKQVRWSKEEVEVEKEEKAEKKKKAMAKVKKAEKHCLVRVQRVAAKENEIQEQVEHGGRNTACLDQVNQDLYQEHWWQQAERELVSRPILPANDNDMGLGEADDPGVETDDPPDFPPMSTVDTTGEYESDGDGDKDFIPKAEGEDDEKESEDEDLEAAFKLWLKTRGSKGKDVIGKTKEKEKDIVGKTKKKETAKEKGELHAVINKACDAGAENPLNEKKRKATMEVNGDPVPVQTVDEPEQKGKHAKATEIRGLKANWKKAVGLTTPKAKATGTTSHHESSPEGQDADDLLDIEGEFAEDESAAMLKAMCERKAHWTATTSNMGIALKPVENQVQSPKKHRKPKPRYNNSDLPFENHSQDLATWRNKVLPPIIDWAGSHDDTFAVGADPSFKTIVKEFWDQSFQTVEPPDAVYAVASSAIRNWWSRISKRMLANLSRTFKGEPFKSSAPVIKSYVEHSLTHMNFVYHDPNVGYDDGSLCSSFEDYLEVAP